MIRVVLPAPLRALARSEGEEQFDLAAPITQRAVIDAIEERHPRLRNTLRDPATGRRRAFIRFYAVERDLSDEDPGAPLPAEVQEGREPYLVIGALSGG
jgi:hypothetical protein